MPADNPLLNLLLSTIVSKNPLQTQALTSAVEQLSLGETQELEDYLRCCTDGGMSISDLAEAYHTITLDTLREQLYFQRHGQYRCSTFREVASSVYYDAEYMSKYMHGLAVTLYLWPNHLRILRFFRETLPRTCCGQFLEIGPGHGVFFKSALRLGSYSTYLGVDISATSLSLTCNLLQSDPTLPEKPWHLVNADFLKEDFFGGPYDAIVMGEVLEHVEEPVQFLRKIRTLSHEASFIFVTTAVNAPAIDHIFLFRSVEQVHDLVTDANMRVARTLAIPYIGCTMDESVQKRLPINVAMVLQA